MPNVSRVFEQVNGEERMIAMCRDSTLHGIGGTHQKKMHDGKSGEERANVMIRNR